jgi:hypothetical protein
MMPLEPLCFWNPMRHARRTPALLALALLLPLAGCVPGAADPDLDDDGWVGIRDVELALACVERDPASAPGCAVADTNGDGRVDGNDVFSLAADYGKRVCNGSAALCDRRYDQVAFATSHNAFSTWARFGLYFNQWDDLPVQLEHGLRGFMLDSWYFDANGSGTIEPAETFLCHADCTYARRPLDEGLAELRAFLDTHPGEVLTIIFESYISPADTAAAFERSGLTPYALPHVPGTPWPTLREMIESGRRLVVVTDRRPPPAPDWLVYVWSVAWETHFTNLYRSDFRCTPNRGSTTNELFILNHFLTRNTSVPGEALQTNANPFLVDRARQCWRESGHLPNFPTVDFATTGDVVGAARLLNADFTATGGAPPAP